MLDNVLISRGDVCCSVLFVLCGPSGVKEGVGS